MKKSSLIILCILWHSANSQAQILIPKLGASLSTIDINGTSGVKNKIGFIGGIALELRLQGRFSIQPELLFHQQGKRSDADIQFPGWIVDQTGQLQTGQLHEDYSLTLNYLELPLLAKAKFGSFYINAGPSVAVGLGGKYKTKVSGFLNENYEGKVKFGTRPNNDRSDDTYIDNNVDVGVQIGGGYVIANLILVDLRYGFGLVNIFDKNSTIGRYDNKSKLRSFQVTVGVPIKLRKK